MKKIIYLFILLVIVLCGYVNAGSGNVTEDGILPLLSDTLYNTDESDHGTFPLHSGLYLFEGGENFPVSRMAPEPSENQSTIPFFITTPAREDTLSGKQSDPACLLRTAGVKNFDNRSRRLSAAEEEDKIKKAKDYIKKNNLSWTAGKTTVSNLTSDGFSALLGLKHPPKGEILPVRELSSSTILKTSIPAAFDWRDNGGDWTTPIRDQDSCGSCWAFASTGTFESFWERVNNDPSLNPNFAEQYLVSCDTSDSGCSGGFSSALAYFVNVAGSGAVGTVNETDWPYSATEESCKSLTGIPRYKVPTGGSWHYLQGDCTVSSVDAIKQAIYTKGPLNSYLYATPNFAVYTGGIFEDPGNDFGSCITNHVVVLVGWGHDPVKNKDYWIGKNSWGTGWGESGWFRIYTDQCRIGEGIAYLEGTDTPAITAISPLSGYKNTTVPFTLAGNNFIPGTKMNLTKSGYGPIEGQDLSITATQIQGNLAIPADAATGFWDIEVRDNGGGVVIRTNGFTVNNYPAPVVSTISPVNGYRNNTVSIKVTGYNFQPGAVLNLTKSGYGNVTATINTLSTTQITGSFDIPADAPAGTWNVNVTTKDGGERGRINGFTSKNPLVPVVTSITPASANRNNTISFTVTGNNFQPGAVVNLTKAGYGNITATINTLTATQIAGSVDIPADAPTGTWNVNVTTKDGGERGQLSGFTITTTPAPIIQSANPYNGYRNTTVPITISGRNFQQGAVVNLTKTGYGNVTATINTLTTTRITGSFDIPADAPTGTWNVNVTTKDGGERGKLNGFTVYSYPAPAVTVVNPASGYTNATTALTVTGTNFEQGAVVNLTKAGYGNITATINTLTATQIAGSVDIPADAPTGTWNVNVTTKDGGERGKMNGFTVITYPAPLVLGITPASGYRNNTIAFTVNGSYYQQGSVVNLTKAGYGNITATINTLTATQIAGSFDIPAGVPTGTWNVNVTTKDGGERGKMNGFTMNPFPQPAVTSITPAKGYRNDTVSFKIAGSNFQQGAVVNLTKLGYGNITATLSSITPTQLFGSFAIPDGVPTGTWNVNVTTKDGGERGKLNGFTVQDIPAPAVSALTPITGYRNNTAQFTLYGNYFQQGAIVNLSRMEYGNVTATSSSITATQILGSFALPEDAPTGKWNLSVSTKDGGKAFKVNVFTVNLFPASYISRITPLTGNQDSTVTFIVYGNNFQQGAVVNLTRAGSSSIMGALNSITATQIRGQFVLPADAPPGLWNVNVTTKDGGERSKVNAFTINARTMSVPTTVAAALATPVVTETTPAETPNPAPEMTTEATPEITSDTGSTTEPTTVPPTDIPTSIQIPVPSESITDVPTASPTETDGLPTGFQIIPEETDTSVTPINETVNGTGLP